MAVSRIRCRATWHFQGRGLFWERESYTFRQSQPHISMLPPHFFTDGALQFTCLFFHALSFPFLFLSVISDSELTGSPCISRLIQLPLLSPVYQPSELVSKRVSIYQDLVRASEDVKCEELQGCWNCRLMWGNQNHAVIPTKLSTNLFYF